MASELRPRFKSGSSESEKPLRSGEFWAVKDVNFELHKGECLGLIGHNGAGKTTLLKLLNGLIKPDTGKITMRGRVGALIALGAGFNPILTGRENILINGSVLGLSKREIESKMEEIIDFAEIGDFIDSPVQNYSSGMTVRLGFAIASNLEPEVVLLDEVLAVGDERFQLKCYERIGRLLNEGVAGILVTHQMQHVERTCTRCLVMDHGSVALDTSDIASAASLYRQLGRVERTADDVIEIFQLDNSPIQIEQSGIHVTGRRVTLELDLSENAPTQTMVSYALYFKGCELLRRSSSTHEEKSIDIKNGRLTLEIPEELAKLGSLSLNLSLWEPGARKALLWIKGIPVKDVHHTEYSLGLS